MFGLPTETIERLAELAPTAFYLLMGIALFTALFGAVGAAVVFLVLGAAVHVARVGLEALWASGALSGPAGGRPARPR